MTVPEGSVEISAEQVARMLVPGCSIFLVQVGAMHSERLMSLGSSHHSQGLLEQRVVPLLVWQLGSLQSQGQDKAANQVARALLAVAGGGRAFQDNLAEAGGVEMLLAAVDWEDSPDTGTICAAAIGNLSANNHPVKNRV
eukprot:scaffold33402_cov36-Prasinocladus_malaysianus.AAC.1